MATLKRVEIQSVALENASIGYTLDDSVAQNVNFELPLGKNYWLKGESGAGKSALLKIFSSLLVPPAGYLKINNSAVSEMAFEEFLPYRLNIGYGFDFGGLLNNKTLFENMILPLEYHQEISRNDAKERVESYFEFFGIASYKNIRPALVGGSFRKLTCILRAFVQKPKLILLDDITTGLSEGHLKNLVKWIHSYRDENPKCTIIITAQDSFLMNKISCDELWITRGKGVFVRTNLKEAV